MLHHVQGVFICRKFTARRYIRRAIKVVEKSIEEPVVVSHWIIRTLSQISRAALFSCRVMRSDYSHMSPEITLRTHAEWKNTEGDSTESGVKGANDSAAQIRSKKFSTSGSLQLSEF